MKQQDMDTHVTVLGWLYILGNGVLLSIGAIGWFFLVGFFSLFSFPLGTALAIYTFWVLLQDDSDDYFIVPKAI